MLVINEVQGHVTLHIVIDMLESPSGSRRLRADVFGQESSGRDGKVEKARLSKMFCSPTAFAAMMHFPYIIFKFFFFLFFLNEPFR